jgi:hypothetical protein
VPRELGPVRIQKHVRIDRDHERPSIRS